MSTWFGMDCKSDWKPGSPRKLLFTDGRVADAGAIVESALLETGASVLKPS